MESITATVDREREFHNKRFQDGLDTREAQDKYYYAIKQCYDDYLAYLHDLSLGAVVLDYGCAQGYATFLLAEAAKEIHGIDISDVAIDTARERAASLGLTNAHFIAGDAHATGYEDETFDLVFGSGIIHHLDTRRSLEEIRRILKPGGVAVFREPLGGNPVFDTYRKLTPGARTEDEHPLLRSDFAIADELFTKTESRFYGLTTLAVVPFRRTPLAEPLLRTLGAVDRQLVKVPGVRWWSWYALMTMTR